MRAESRKAVFAALAANMGIAAAKFVGFAITGASSMLAEAVHSVADTGNQGLLLLGSARSRKQPDAAHPFGYGTERYFWAFIVSLVLFSLGAMFAVYEGVEKLRHPHEIDTPAVAITILVVAIALEALSFRTAVREARPHRGEASWREFIRHAREPELPVVLLEDLAALVGLTLALAGVGLSAATHNSVFDAYGTLAIGALLGVVAVVLAVEMKSLLIGEAAVAADEEALRRAVEGIGGVRTLIWLKTMHLGPDELLVAAKVEVDPSLGSGGVADAINEAEAAMRARVPIARMILIEPDRFEPGREHTGG